jgi:hypothetical protein
MEATSLKLCVNDRIDSPGTPVIPPGPLDNVDLSPLVYGKNKKEVCNGDNYEKWKYYRI